MSVPLPWRHHVLSGHTAPLDRAAAGALSHVGDRLRLPLQFLAFREGRADGRAHSLEDTAARFGIDLPFAQRVDAYLAARRRLHVSRAGWRAGLPRAR